MTTSIPVKPLILLTMLLSAAPAAATQLVSASLKNGDYGTGGPVAPTSGVVATPDGVVYVPTEPSGRSNALVNWQIGNNPQWRRTGTITFLFKASRGQLATGEILGDNYGFGMFNNGQGAFSASASIALHGPGPEDDRVAISWRSWHNGTWYAHSSTEIEFDRWYSLGFAWGGPFEFEIWVNQVRQSAVNIAGAFPWGLDSPPSGYNMGLGDNHERGVDPYNSAAGVSFADVRMWNEYRALGDTVDPNHAPSTTDDAYDTTEDGALTIGGAGVLENDNDPDGDALEATLVTGVSYGTLSLETDGSFTYEPLPGFHGTDTFTYRASDGALTADATVTITIASVNDAPTTTDVTVTTDAGVPVNVTLTATDADSASLLFEPGPATGGQVSGASPNFVFTPAPGFSGVGGFSFVVRDPEGASAFGQVTVNVTPIAPPPDGIAAIAAAIAQLPGLNHGQRTSLLARLTNAARALERGHRDVAIKDLRHVAEALERFSSSAEAAEIVARLRALAAEVAN